MKTALLLPFRLTIVLSVLLTACYRHPTLKGDALVGAAPSKHDYISDALHPLIDTTCVYALRIVRCPECVHSLSMHRLMTPDSCLALPCSALQETGITDSTRLALAIARRAALESVSIHYLRFIDEKRVVYGARKGSKLPESLDLETRFRKVRGNKLARGYYYISNGNLYLRLQDRRSHKLFDWVLAIQQKGAALKLEFVTSYDAHEDAMHSAGFSKGYELDNILSYNFTFYRLDSLTIPLKRKQGACLGLPPTEHCANW